MVHSSCPLYDRRPLKEAKGGFRETLYVGMASTQPLSLNKCNSSEFSNAGAISHFRHIMWPTSVSIHDNTLKGGKIHCYIHEIAKTPISPSSSSSNGLVRIYLDFVSKGFLFPCAGQESMPKMPYERQRLTVAAPLPLLNTVENGTRLPSALGHTLQRFKIQKHSTLSIYM